MKILESGMPEETYWESLLDVERILRRLGVDDALKNVVEVGCGYGTFTIPVAQRVHGRLTAIDIDPNMVARTQSRVKDAGLKNVVCRQADVLKDGFGVRPASQDGCLLFNILHGEHAARLLAVSANIVRAGGMLFVIHWRYDPATPRGPNMAIRPRPADIVAWAEDVGALHWCGAVIDLPPWHYGLRFVRRGGKCL